MGIYENIRKIASEKGYSINRLEKELGFPRGSMYKYNESMPNTEKLIKISEELNCTIDELIRQNNDIKRLNEKMGYYKNEATQQATEDAYHNERMHLLFNAQKGASDEAVRKAAEYLEALKIAEKIKEIY